MFLKRKEGVTERPRSLNPSKAIAIVICPILVHFSTWRARSMHDVACEFARAVVSSKDAQKQLARTSLTVVYVQHFNPRYCRVSVELGREKFLIFKLSR